MHQMPYTRTAHRNVARLYQDSADCLHHSSYSTSVAFVPWQHRARHSLVPWQHRARLPCKKKTKKEIGHHASGNELRLAPDTA